ncbi:MAG: hypothetical protein AAGC73_03155 [Verrucomicrobiota bacterium]
MRIFLLSILCLTLAGCASKPKEAITSVEIKEVKARSMQTEDFKRITEYLTGPEHQGKRVIIRTDPDARDGFYFTLVLDTKLRKLPRGTLIIGEFHTPNSLDPETHTFALPNKLPKTKQVFVGLTGENWAYDESAVPAAWRFTIQGPNGEVMAVDESYLWRL